MIVEDYWINKHGDACGLIYEGRQFLGSGFVVTHNSKIQVITSAHSFLHEQDSKVPLRQQYISFSNQVPGENQQFKKLKLVNHLYDYDISIWESPEALCKFPIQLSKTCQVAPREKVYFYGYHKFDLPEKRAQTKFFGKGIVVDTGQTIAPISGHIVTFLDIEDSNKCVGEGYSGGVTFNKDGEAIAINSQAYRVYFTEGNKEFRILRSFSLAPIL